MKTISLHALTVIILALFMVGCGTPPQQGYLNRLKANPSWPEIQKVAEAEVAKREKSDGWKDTSFSYMPLDLKDKVWIVRASYRNIDIRRVIVLHINESGEVLDYQRHTESVN